MHILRNLAPRGSEKFLRERGKKVDKQKCINIFVTSLKLSRCADVSKVHIFSFEEIMCPSRTFKLFVYTNMWRNFTISFEKFSLKFLLSSIIIEAIQFLFVLNRARIWSDGNPVFSRIWFFWKDQIRIRSSWDRIHSSARPEELTL